MGDNMQEATLVLYENLNDETAFVASSIGSPGQVEFPFEKIWKFKKDYPLFNPSCLKFFHTHPEGYIEYSNLDINCIKGLNLAFDFPVYFSIICFENPYCLEDLTHQQLSYVYYKKMIEVKDFTLDDKNLYLLKYLTYKDLL